MIKLNLINLIKFFKLITIQISVCPLTTNQIETKFILDILSDDDDYDNNNNNYP